ncbi:hypothetical protein Tco_1231456 [Tanacetum coccineum]
MVLSMVNLIWGCYDEVLKNQDLALILLGSLPSEHELLETTLPIVEEVETQDFTVEDVVLKDYLFYDDEGITTAYETEYDVQSSEDACIDDDDDDDEYFLVDEENEIVEPDADVHLFGISMDLPFENIGVTNLIPDDVLEGEEGFQISMSKAFRAKAKAKRDIRGDHVLQYSMLRDYVIELQYTNPNTTAKIAVERNIDPSLPTRVFKRIYVCLGALKLDFKACIRDLLGLKGAFMKGTFPGQVLVAIGLDSNNGIYPLHMRWLKLKGWCGQAYKDLLWRAASATNVKDFEKCRAKSDLLLNNIYGAFNGKIVGGRDKSMITLLEYIKEYCMKRIVNVQSVIDKCTGLLTPTTTRIIESIKKEAYLMKVQ